jgi:hypothetical protein
VQTYVDALFSDGALRRRLRPTARKRSEVLAHHIDEDGHKDKTDGDPNTPITMRTFPVRTSILKTMGLRPSVKVMTLLTIIHWFPSFSILSQIFSHSHPFHRGIVFAAVGSWRAPVSIIQGLLCRQHSRLLSAVVAGIWFSPR